MIIKALLDSNGGVVVKYIYDAWGNHAVVDANGNDITDEGALFVEKMKVINDCRHGTAKKDLSIRQEVYWQKNAYYGRKGRLIEKIFGCCILEGYVRYEEIMGMAIA